MEETTLEKTSQPGLGMTIAKNTLVVTLGSLVLKVINFLFNIYVIRRLGDDRFGQYSVVLAFVGIYQIFAELGISVYVMRETAKDRSRAESLFWNLVAVRMILALIAMAAMPLIASAMGYSSQLILGVLLFGVSFILSAVTAPLQGVLTAYERFDLVTAMNVAGQVVFVLFGAAFLLSGLSYIWLIVASLIGLVPQIAIGAWGVRRNQMLRLRFQVEPGTWLKLVRAGLPFAVISLTLSVSYKIDTIILKAYQPDAVVGWYNAAYNLVFSLMFLTAGFKDAIVPSLSRAFVSDPQQVERWYYRTLKMMVILSLPVAVGGMILSFPLIRTLYTDAYAPSALALQVLIWDVPFMMFAGFCGNITTIINREKLAARIYGINAVANVLMNLYAIPHFGLMGAAVTTVMTDLIGSVQFYILLRRDLHLPSVRGLFLKSLLAVVGMGIAVYAARGWNLILSILLGAGVYLVLVVALRLLDQAEWALIGRVLRLNTKL